MIWESSYWKDDLNKIAVRMRKRQKYKRLYNKSYYLLEKDIYFAFFAIRKMIEVKTKLSTSVTDITVSLDTFAIKEDVNVTLVNNHKLDDLYDFDKSTKQTTTIKKLCNLFMHSYILNIITNDNNGLDGFLFTSDWDKNEILYKLDINQFIDICRKVSDDDIVSSSGIYNKETKEWEFKNLNHKQAMKENPEYTELFEEKTWQG